MFKRFALVLGVGAVGLTVGAAGVADSAAAPATGSPARAAKPCLVPGTGKPLDQIWRPDMRAARAYNDHRAGDVAFAVRTEGRFYGYRPDHVEWSASVVKAMLIVAYLDRGSVANRPLNGNDSALLVPMITHSDNNAATTVRGIVGNGGLQALANRVGMTHFATAAIWGETHITAGDQTKFFLHIDKYVAARHRAYAMHLLASITPSQRWGIGEVAPKGWKLYFKGGWGYGTGLLDHQVVLLTRGCARVSMAVLTMYDGSHQYGKDTLRGIFSRLLRKFPTGQKQRRR
jgi:beta-lactamase family protein